jgi:hypothetical protein
MNPLEVIVSYKDNDLGSLYNLGFTFSPFGRPDRIVHFLAWDDPSINGKGSWALAHNQNSRHYTIHDLVHLVSKINSTIKTFFKNNGSNITDYPQLDGAFNGWAGNSGWHEHYQFFELEKPFPIYKRACTPGHGFKDENLKLNIEHLDWPLCISKISSSEVDVLIRAATVLDEDWLEDNPGSHTQNIIVHLEEGKPIIYHIKRDRNKVDARDVRINDKSFSKSGFAVLESAGVAIIDDEKLFAEIGRLSDKERSEVYQQWLEQIQPTCYCDHYQSSCPIIQRFK